MNASEMLHEFFSAYLKVVFDYFIHKAAINILTRMIRDYGCSPHQDVQKTCDCPVVASIQIQDFEEFLIVL